MSEHPRLALSELHLAAEAIVAYLDGELAPGPEQRATQHLEHCSECRAVLAVQRQAKSTLGLACAPCPDQDLLQKLRNIPVDTELPGSGLPGPGGAQMTLAMQGEQMVWRSEPATKTPKAPKAPKASKAPKTGKPAKRPRRRSRPGPDVARRDSAAPQRRNRHVGNLGRGLFGAAAAVMVGMLAVTTPSSASGSGTHEPSTPTSVDRSVETTNVVTASIPHVFGDEPQLLTPQAERTGVAFLSSHARP